MKLPWNWLKELVKTNETIEEIAEKLTMIGLEVESIEGAHSFEKVIIGEILDIAKHPNADKLHLTKVNIGLKDPLQIVCGANNLSLGIKVPVVLIGGKVSGMQIKKANLRGVDSYGMIASEMELGLGTNHDGIMVLDKNAKIGTDFAEYIGNEKVIDVSVLANRPDCMGIWGLAAEVAAATNKKLVLPQIKLNEDKNTQAKNLVNIKVEAGKLCPRYMARVVKNVQIAPSPKWMQEKLLALGIRPINNVVDISNYVMLETAQPLHFFDYQKLAKTKDKASIVIRTAVKNEKIITLDGVERKLNEEVLTITDGEKPIAIAGVMGALNSEVGNKSTDILVEAAIFDKTNIRRTSRKLGLRSEAVARFEKGLPNMLPEVAINRAAQLLSEIAKGKVAEGWVDVASETEGSKEILLNPEKARRFLGTKITDKEIIGILYRLGFIVTKKNDNYKVVSPWWRTDIKTVADIYEEIIRIFGYDKIPSTLPTMTDSVPVINAKLSFIDQAKNLLADLGLTEILTYPFVTEMELKLIGTTTIEAPKIMNPLVKEQEYLRPNLLSGMVKALVHNQFLRDSLAFFEVGKGFKNTKPGKLPTEADYLTLGFVGGDSWPIKNKDNETYYKAKGVIERFLADFGLLDATQFAISHNQCFAKGVVADVVVSGKNIGVIGEINNQIAERFGLRKKAVISQIDIGRLLTLIRLERTYREISKYPTVTRDISAVFSLNTPADNIKKSIEGIDHIIQKVEIIDIYSGKPLHKDEKSISIRVHLGSIEKTLKVTEVEKVMAKCHNKVKELGGNIRGESK